LSETEDQPILQCTSYSQTILLKVLVQEITKDEDELEDGNLVTLNYGPNLFHLPPKTMILRFHNSTIRGRVNLPQTTLLSILLEY